MIKIRISNMEKDLANIISEVDDGTQIEVRERGGFTHRFLVENDHVSHVESHSNDMVIPSTSFWSRERKVKYAD